MGYYYEYELRILGKFPNDEAKQVIENGFFDGDPPNGYGTGNKRLDYHWRSKWYPDGDDLKKLSKNLPGYGVLLIGRGESLDSMWMEAFYDGKEVGGWDFCLEDEAKKLIMKIDQARENATSSN